ncbi:tetratricopeptide repeat protein [Mariprofundus sp. KV]|uniref:tetratricopeptide repeat protein n=1 Tax=Mariprofundus sp. KV TaxID=2608715 RepID=UPI0015A19352|nr:tetratricopeptide repeat protein [Mariprofundus sp. KV]NWF36295.1 tetratricopeptide repeat protein [Mariprofundus sp. KV]
MISCLRKAATLLLCSALLGACSIQKSDRGSEAHESEAAQKRQQQQIEQMDPPFLYLAAQNALKDGNRPLAARFLTALVEKEPEAIEPQIQLTSLLLQLGKTEEAERHIALLLKKELKKEDLEQLLLTQARMKVAKNKQDEALPLLDQLFKENPANLSGRDLQARILSGQSRYAEALAAIDVAIRSEELPEFRLLQAQLFLKQEDSKAARVSLQRMRLLAPENDTAVLLLSNISLQDNDTDRAEKELRDFLNAYPDAIRVGHALGKLLIQENRIAEAILIYRDLANQSGQNPEILKTLGILYFRYKDFEKSEATFKKLNQNSPDDQSRFYLAASLEALERPDEAQPLYEQIDPKGAMGDAAQIRLAGIDFANDDLKSALTRLQTVLKSKPSDTEAHLMRSAIRLAQKQYSLLLEETSELSTMNKVHPQLLFNRAVAFDHLKQYDQLELMLSQLLTHAPKHSEAMNFLGYSYAIQGIELHKAEKLILKALELKPDDGYYLDSLAWVYFKRGEFKKALTTQNRALKQISDDPIMFEHLGDILWKNGDQPAAREAWEKSLQMNSDDSDAIKHKIKHGLDGD